ncbi:hypothetical protein PLICRDRAFT_205452 [Plicaturopsis crispa FD-325 SS-3]|nr:hypothetical protein PLICRDRAFT_205452 [Plicaturopsis crispa FD-325 SS-3]
MEPSQSKPTDYSYFVNGVLARMTREKGAVDQLVLRRCLSLSASYLVTDHTMRPSHVLHTWSVGFNRLIDVVVALHKRTELELETINEASKACSECWSIAGTWRGFEECKETIRSIAAKLKELLDANGKTYRGERVYVP